jgi:hypothetical protein
LKTIDAHKNYFPFSFFSLLNSPSFVFHSLWLKRLTPLLQQFYSFPLLIFFLFSSLSLQSMGCMSSHLLMHQIFKSSFHLSPSNHTSNHWIQTQIQSFELNPFNGPSNSSLKWHKNILCLSKTSQNYKFKFLLHKLWRIKCWKWNESENFEKTQQIFVWSNFKITIEQL